MAKPSKPKQKNANPMWGGQFSRAPSDLMAEINVSIGVDKALYAEDIAGSIAHAEMLAKQGIISKADGAAITKGLKEILREIEAGQFEFKESLEDIHMNIEARLAEKIGAAAGRLHTARSRNDQVATDFKLYIRGALGALDGQLKALQQALVKRADEHTASIMPGYTHLQAAQPVTLGHHLMAYVEMFGRDRTRAQDAVRRMNESPLGAAALAGTSFPIDRHMTAKALGFDAPMANSLDSVSGRDFALEYLAVCSIVSVHLSRLAEELVLWSSPAFGFIRFSDSFSTGSSIMPQKRNPDAAELVRGKTGRVVGSLVSLLTTMKALPLAYNKDMQEDKEPVMDAARTMQLVVPAMCGMVLDFTADTKAMHRAASQGYSTATDLADWLVRELKLPFREAHHATAKIVKRASDKNCALADLSLAEMKAVLPAIHKGVFEVLSVEQSTASRTSFGGTAPGNVKAAIAHAKKRFGL
ncbi:MAG: argininosuccinate lyase [Alphaproteobacteria bacterium]|nr:argininosuccinate lyase [Alphaproteobacteria bacterium]